MKLWAAWFVILLIPLQVAAQSLPPEHGRFLRFVTYNVWGLPNPLLKKPSRLKEIAKRLPSLDADVIAFEESFTKMAHVLTKRPEFPYVAWGPKDRFPRVSSGLVIISRWPIVEKAKLVYRHCRGTDCLARKGVVYARIRIGNVGDVDVFATHLNAAGSDKVRIAQVNEMSAFIAKHVGHRPMVLLGDFNMDQDTELYDRVVHLNDLKDTHLEYVQANPDLPDYEKQGLTSDWRVNSNIPSSDPPRRIDYIFTHSDGQRVETRLSKLVFDKSVNGQFLSDHFGVAADLAIEPVEPDVGSTLLVSAPAHRVFPELR